MSEVLYWTREQDGTWSGPWTRADLLARSSLREIGPKTPCSMDGSGVVVEACQLGVAPEANLPWWARPIKWRGAVLACVAVVVLVQAAAWMATRVGRHLEGGQSPVAAARVATDPVSSRSDLAARSVEGYAIGLMLSWTWIGYGGQSEGGLSHEAMARGAAKARGLHGPPANHFVSGFVDGVNDGYIFKTVRKTTPAVDLAAAFLKAWGASDGGKTSTQRAGTIAEKGLSYLDVPESVKSDVVRLFVQNVTE